MLVVFPMTSVECPFRAFFALAFGCDCGVVHYHKSRRATIFSPKKLQRLTQDAHKSLLGTPHNQQTLLLAMPPTFVQHTPIDSEWAEALVGLRLNVPNSWWPGFVDGGLNRGRNLDALNAFHFKVKLDNELGAHYTMRYDSILLYADEGQPGFSHFHLPMLCPGNPNDEMVRVRVLIGKNGGTMVDDDFIDKEIVDGDEDVDFFDSRNDAVNDANDAADGSYSEGAPATKEKRKKGATKKMGGKRATKRNKTCQLNNTTINPDLVLQSGKRDTDGEEGNTDGYSGGDDDSNSDNDFFEEKRYKKMKAKNWTKHTDGRPGREIHPIPFGGMAETFRPKVSEEELKGFTDEHGDIRFCRIYEWMLPSFDGVSFYKFLAARMRNYMLHIIKEKGRVPKYYRPSDKKYILADDVARFFGCQLARSLSGNPSIERCWSIWESLDAIGTCMESMPKNAFEDIYSCLHFNDDWNDGEEWEDDTYTDRKMCSPDDTAHHRQKFLMFEDGFNIRWKECVEFGKWLTFDESRVAGWYHSPITQGPDPKPIQTGTTIYSLAITHGDLASYKVHVQVFGGKTAGDLGKTNNNTITIQKWVNLLSVMLDAFKNNGHYITMDSAYMGNIMVMIGRDV